ncbi:MarR family winged helix-turn-helix transcriptional regulator [Pandoraea norimbergensis]|uniref:MFS transporter n=1 Tax=Pandoraea norimbergensis TaxID=93219 RepID=A0ABM5WMV2_9BURK|nr:MarR family transcriptional regulator [Pandoraea norimbergensis]ALS61868.1 MFS transporter [Pandoraea norimbergensis]
MNHYDRNNFQLTQSVGFYLSKARNLLAAEMDQALKPLDLTGPQMGILRTLGVGEITTPLEMSKMLAMDSGSTTRMLDKLEAKGLISRHRSTEDRRVVKLALTPAGKRVDDQIPDIAPHVLNHRLKDFSAEEFKQFLNLLKKFVGD